MGAELVKQKEDKKTCNCCWRTLPLTEFSPHPGLIGGYRNQCKSCKNSYTQKRREAYREHVKTKERESRERHHKAYLDRMVKYRKENKTKSNARYLVKLAIKEGRLKRLPCVECGGWAEAHHEDYSKPLDVVWLCSVHHGVAHRKKEYDKTKKEARARPDDSRNVRQGGA